jgi:hypothetical protein
LHISIVMCKQFQMKLFCFPMKSIQHIILFCAATKHCQLHIHVFSFLLFLINIFLRIQHSMTSKSYMLPFFLMFRNLRTKPLCCIICIPYCPDWSVEPYTIYTTSALLSQLTWTGGVSLSTFLTCVGSILASICTFC